MQTRVTILLGLTLGWRLCAAPERVSESGPQGGATHDESSNDSVMTAADPEQGSAAHQFNSAYRILVSADEARDAGQWTEAMGLYRTALTAYTKLAKTYPHLQPGIVRFRTAYCGNQLEAVLQKMTGKKFRAETMPGQIAEPAGGESPGGESRVAKSSRAAEAPDSEAIKSAATVLLKNGETEKAAAVLLNGLRLDPDNGAIRLLMGMVQCQAGRFDDAMYLVEQLIEEDPSNANAHVVLGTVYFGLGQTAKAREKMERALDLDPYLSEAHYDLAQILLATKPLNLPAVRYHYRKALELGGAPDKNLDFLLK